MRLRVIADIISETLKLIAIVAAIIAGLLMIAKVMMDTGITIK